MHPRDFVNTFDDLGNPIVRALSQSISLHDNENTVEHRYKFFFEQPLAETQRAQFEREMLRKRADT